MGEKLLHPIRSRKYALTGALLDVFTEDSVQELAKPLTQGDGLIPSQHERDYKRIGNAFADGDGES